MIPTIELVGLGRVYEGTPPVEALRGCDLSVLPGEYVTVVGPSGSGKSTLLNLIGLLDRPTSGDYRLDGVDTATLSEKERTALRGTRIGFVFQSFHLLPHRSALENVTLAMLYNGVDRRERADRARAALERVGLGSRIDAPAAVLSGGEKQRVAIARAVVAEPAVLLCDEPTGSLDSRNGADVLDLLDTLSAGGMTICVITHDTQVAARGGRTVAVADGTVSEVTR